MSLRHQFQHVLLAYWHFDVEQTLYEKAYGLVIQTQRVYCYRWAEYVQRQNQLEGSFASEFRWDFYEVDSNEVADEVGWYYLQDFGALHTRQIQIYEPIVGVVRGFLVNLIAEVAVIFLANLLPRAPILALSPIYPVDFQASILLRGHE